MMALAVNDHMIEADLKLVECPPVELNSVKGNEELHLEKLQSDSIYLSAATAASNRSIGMT